MKRVLQEKIAGEITLSSNPGQTIRKWRKNFDISQHTLSEHLRLSPSVISDYESGRRKSPGVVTIRKIIESFFEIDESRGGEIIKRYTQPSERSEAIFSINEFSSDMRIADFLKGCQAK